MSCNLRIAVRKIRISACGRLGDRRRACYDRKAAAGKTPKQAMRCLKRRLSDLVYKTMLDDLVTSARTGPGGHGETSLIPARPFRIPTPALWTSHFPDPPTASLEPAASRVLTQNGARSGVHAERWQCIKIRPRRCLRGRGRGRQSARRTRDNRAPSRRSGRHAVPGSAVSVLRSGHTFHRSRGRPRRRHLQRISPSASAVRRC
jgi:hypothetical protein